MRQAGYLAAAGIYALENNIKRLKEDHKRAKAIEEALKKSSIIEDIMPVDTNIIIFKLVPSITHDEFLKKLADQNIKAASTAKQTIRMVTHLDFNDEMLENLIKVLKNNFK